MQYWTSFRIRNVAALFWSLGLALVCFDRFHLYSILGEQVRIAYPFFLVAGILCWWGEKREFGTRVMLYRLHDIAMSSPWKYLLLYFLWVNLFALFSAVPRTSVVYALGGWFSLVMVAFSAQLLFCQRTPEKIILIPQRLKIALLSYTLASMLYGLSLVVSSLAPNLGVRPFFMDVSQVCVFFVAGLPFLVWDFINPRRQLLNRPLVGFTIVVIVSTLFLLRQPHFLLAAVAAPLALLFLGLAKRVSLHRALLGLFFLCLLSINLLFVFKGVLSDFPGKQALEGYVHREVTEEYFEVKKAWELFKSTNFMGGGIGSSDVKRNVWLKIVSEVGVVGILLYGAFFISLLWDLFRIRRSKQIVISNVAFVSVVLFLLIGSHFPRNPYGTGIWVWYALWGVFSSTRLKTPVRMESKLRLVG